MHKKLLFLVLVLSVCLSSFAQYNFSASFPVVYHVLNTKCQNQGCHSATSGDALKFDGTPASVWASLVSQPPANPGSLARGEQLVWIDQPYQSYLLKKAGSWFDTDLALPANETDSAHFNAGLTNKEVEYIRQWIMDSAAQVMLNIDTATINAYYNDTAASPFFPKLSPPATGNGMQVRYGPIFVRGTSGDNEVEYMLMHQINFPSDMEVIGVESSMNSESHHFLLFQFPDSADGVAQETGLRRVVITGNGIVSPFDGQKDLIAAWQTSTAINLPTGTAFFWSQKTYLDMDYHVKNYTSPGESGIIPFDFYLNITYRPRVISDNTIQMKSNLQNNIGIVLPPHTITTLPYSSTDNMLVNETRYVWMMSSHTHKFGTGFNIYKYDTTKANGIGDTLYKGTYDYTNGIDLGVYDWEHPQVEYFNTLYPMNMKTNGFTCQTTWDNDSSTYIHFGFTTSDEMQLFYYMYTTELPAVVNGINAITSTAFDFDIYPNPMGGAVGTISYTLPNSSDVQASIIDITGKDVATLKNEQEQAGTYKLDLGSHTLSSGMYFARVSVNGETYTKKFVVE